MLAAAEQERIAVHAAAQPILHGGRGELGQRGAVLGNLLRDAFDLVGVEIQPGGLEIVALRPLPHVELAVPGAVDPVMHDFGHGDGRGVFPDKGKAVLFQGHACFSLHTRLRRDRDSGFP